MLIISIKEGIIIITKVAHYYSSYLCKKVNREEEKEVIAYGIEIVLGAVLKIFTIVLLGFLLGIICEVSIGLIAFSLLRVVSGGFHFQHFLLCYLTSIGGISIISYLSKYVLADQDLFTLPLFQSFFFFIVTSILVIFKPLINSNRPYHNKQNLYLILSIAVVSLLLSFALFLQKTNPSLSITINLCVLAQSLSLIRRKKYNVS
ncbi:hypothetical protein FOH38_08015 [Lysinibacillus fusiformis]|nr:hypothetical protein FOH38_08015 [Lysinibacillus fusiformis]